VKLVTWNVNSLNVRLPHVEAWLKEHQPAVLCLQEIKMEDAKFPREAIESLGYHVVFDGQKTYNGVAIIAKAAPQNVTRGIAGYADEQKRVIAATVDGVRVVCVYIPNGQSLDSDKYQYKLGWLKALTGWLEGELKTHPDLALLGDYNIAPEDRDVHDPKAWEGQVLVSEPERAAFRGLQALGLTDSFRLFDQPEKSFTWWDYRMNGFKRNLGLRIDHVMLSPSLTARCRASSIDIEPRKRERPSDHTPAFAVVSD
jgi:exodeoxyribonuclease III